MALTALNTAAPNPVYSPTSVVNLCTLVYISPTYDPCQEPHGAVALTWLMLIPLLLVCSSQPVFLEGPPTCSDQTSNHPPLGPWTDLLLYDCAVLLGVAMAGTTIELLIFPFHV